MSYEVFKTKVNGLIEKAGGNIKVRFATDPAQGKHFASCSDGTVIIANEGSLRVTVRWGGRNHQSVVAL